jgi:hypothetical protein
MFAIICRIHNDKLLMGIVREEEEEEEDEEEGQE